MLRDSVSHLPGREHRDGGNAETQLPRSPLNKAGHFAFVRDIQEESDGNQKKRHFQIKRQQSGFLGADIFCRFACAERKRIGSFLLKPT